MKIKFNTALIILLMITTFSGAVRKWLSLSSGVNNILLGILLIFPIFLLFYKSIDEKTYKFNIFYIYLFFLIIFASNPLNLTIYHGLFGILVHIGFYALLLSYFKNSSSFEDSKFAIFSGGLLVFEVVLGSIQYVSTPDSFINRYAVEEGVESGVALVGDSIRVTGTFSYIAGFSSFLFLGLFTVFYFIKKEIFKKYSYSLLGFVFYGALISGSRGTVAFVAVTSFVFLITEAKILLNPKLLFNIFGVVVIFIFFNTLLNDPINIFSRVQKSYDNFSLRAENSSEEGKNRLFQDINDVFNYDFGYQLSGIGLGSTYQGANAVFGTSSLASSIGFEGELFRLVVEGGYLLFILRLVILWYFISKLEFSNTFKVFLFLIINLLIPIVFNIYACIYLALGIILLNQSYLDKRIIKIEE